MRDRLVEPPDATRRVVIVDKPDAVQTEIRVGNIGIPRNHQDYMALNLAIRILGGEGSNRLHQVLRTERGLTYGAQADLTTLKESGDIAAETNTRSDATGEVLRLIIDQMWRLQRERVVGGRARGGESLHDRQLSADDRDARFDRAPGAERHVLRPAARTAADLPRTRQRASPSTISNASPASI